MKPVNWISATGRKPSAARPTDMPAMSSSARGVSNTREGPKRLSRPSVARKTPPLTPTSSPSTSTRASISMARASAMLTAWTSVASATAVGPLHRLAALLRELRRQRRVEIVEDRRWRLRRHGHILVDGRGDLGRTVGQQPLLILLAPDPGRRQIFAQPRDRLALPVLADLGVLAIALGIVDRRVVAEPVGQRLDQRRATARARPLECALYRIDHSDDVVAVDLLARKASGDRLLRQGFGRALRSARHRDRPLVVGDDKQHRQPHDAREVGGLVEITLRSAAVADHADRGARLPLELHRQGNAHGMRRLGRHGYADGKVAARAGEVAAALIAAPVEHDLQRLHPAPELGWLLAIGRE